MAEKIDRITADLQMLQDVVKRVNEMLGTEKISYELIRGDIEAALYRKDKLLKENKVIEEQNETYRNEGMGAIKKAEADAKSRITVAKETLVASLVLHERTKEFVNEADKKKWEEHRNKLVSKKEEVELALK